jgi:site-specific DNA-methyltransferase (adenine-specific)
VAKSLEDYEYFKTENGTLYQGDCLKILPLLEDDSVDLVLTDIPYNVVNRKDNGLRKLTKEDADVMNFSISDLLPLCIGKTTYLFCGTEQVSLIRASFVAAGLSTRLLVWEKLNPSPMNGQHIWLSGLECCVFGKSKGAVFNDFCRSPILRYPSGQSKIHPTQKPIQLFGDLIRVSSNEGDTVLDPFLGSGTTAVACEELGRRWIGIELSKDYCEIATKRLEAWKGQTRFF